MSLANRYRPQKFADVVGQEPTIAALSRAAAADRPAPAYLLSGTRGVGKTTIARIFAKALNCECAPAAEPCGTCKQCRQIAAGSHVDVNEIDGASNTGVDDVRALRERVGFAPMEGRYRIFIIDEAHMLSKSAFNALLKTLEEPPPRAVFIFATTEAHRFPATIISRCQHFVFRHLPEDVIFTHLAKTLELEKLEYESGAVRLLARRAAGSVRDGMSLLDQALAVSGAPLTEAGARQALGLAGQELFAKLFHALPQKDLGALLEVSGSLLNAGIDIGFFLRELSTQFRNLFLFSQGGAAILPTLGLGEDEQAFLKDLAALFKPPFLHAAWQMTLENQRMIVMSPQPGAALELLLINLAMLPDLLPVGSVRSSGMGHDHPRIQEINQEAQPVAKPPVSAKAPPPPVPSSANEERKVQESQKDSAAAAAPAGKRDWETFCEYCKTLGDSDLPPRETLRLLRPNWENGRLLLQVPSMALWERVAKRRQELEKALRAFFGVMAKDIEYIKPEAAQSSREAMEKCGETPEMQLCKKIFDAKLLECVPKNGARE